VPLSAFILYLDGLLSIGVMMSGPEAITNLLKRIPDASIIDDPNRLRVYESDGLTAKKQLPALVAIPDTVAALQQIVRTCYQHAIPVVARGAGTGLSGGAMPHPRGVLVSLARFNRILEVDEENLLARIEPGVTNLAISDAVSHLDLFYAPDPSSQVACTIGGNVAENSGGVHCLKYGLTVHNVRGLKILTAEGDIVSVGGVEYDQQGFDLLALLHGSEGMLGIVIEVTVNLIANPASVAVLMAGFDTCAAAADAVGSLIGQGIIPAGLELMDRLAIQAAEDFVQAGYPLDVEALLLCELDGSDDDVLEQVNLVEQHLRKCGAVSVTVAIDASERARLWQGRKAAFPAVGRISPDYYCMDGTIPRKQLAEVLDRITVLSTEYGLRVANVFHAGDGNLHPLILYDANVSGELAAAEAFGAEILELCVAVGGTITGEHGVGVEKIDQMCIQFSDHELAVFHGVKRAFDIKGILNPGKAVPTLNRCAEFGAMHVHSIQASEVESGMERF